MSAASDDEISREELLRRLGDRSLAVVDALPRTAFRAQHIAGSKSLPLAEIVARAREVLPDLAQEVAVYCGGPA